MTPEDVKNGLPYDGNSCPVALAIRRVTVRDLEVAYEHEGDPTRANQAFVTGLGCEVYLPEDVSNFIHAFDNSNGFRGEGEDDATLPADTALPQFELDLPDETA